MLFEMKIRSFAVLLLLVPIVFLLSACTQNLGGTAGSSGTASDEKVDFTIEASSFKFTPDVIEAEPGQTIKVKVNGSGHDLVIDELNVETGLIVGSKTVSITVPTDAQAGDTFEFYCSISNHRAMGMVGTLRVK